MDSGGGGAADAVEVGWLGGVGVGAAPGAEGREVIAGVAAVTAWVLGVGEVVFFLRLGRSRFFFRPPTNDLSERNIRAYYFGLNSREFNVSSWGATRHVFLQDFVQ